MLLEVSAEQSEGAQHILSDLIISKLNNKKWDLRAHGYAELASALSNPNNAVIFNEHCHLWKKYLSEVNSGVLDKVLDALSKFILNAG